MKDRIELDLSRVTTPAELQLLLYEVFAFPGWYGMNWNAFHDSLNDPEQSELARLIKVRGWDKLAQKLPQDAAYLKDDLEQLKNSRPECRVSWC